MYCQKNQFDFAGVKSSNKCYCGKNAPNTQPISNRECSMPCSGNKDQKCGGDWAVKVFSTKDAGKTSQI